MPELLRKPFFTFHRKLFLTIVSLFLVFVVLVSSYQYRREKAFRVGLLTEQLQSYNNLFFEIISDKGLSDQNIRSIMGFLRVHDLRVTVVDFSGNVLYDSEANHPGNHADRPEIKNALALGQGVSERRLSETTGKTFFYAATRYPEFIVRSSRPYDSTLNNQLRVDFNFFLFIVILLLIILLLIYSTTKRMGKTIAQLRDFAETADKNLPLDMNQEFPANELGEISEHIVGLFQRLSSTRNDLLKERDKLFSHLQNTKEGLAIFSQDQEEIVANNLFIQYLNLISEIPAQSACAIFSLPELTSFNQYIHQTKGIRNPVSHLQHQLFHVEKNGKVFQIQCVFFQDNSFEISINDVSRSEEEVRLKRQLTQNIAHELKTPISSIQGYMETIIDNPDLPAEKLHTFVERSFLQSKRLSELLRDISTLTRMDEAPRLLEQEEVNISQLIGQISGELEADINVKNISLHIDIKPDLTVKGNASLLYSVFRNLMDNALAYAGENIEIGIVCFRDEPDRCFFQFYDSGTGIAEEHLNRIFERFYRVDKGRTRKLGGTGLGLAIVKNAVQLHGGSISAKNRPEGGLEFIFSLLK
jgi:signal transduction histidine kinase